MNDIYFSNVTTIGDLRLDYVFFEFELEPILFTCVDNSNKTYLCVCSEMRHFQKWVLSECSLLSLAAMIDGKVDIASTFRKANELITVISDIQGHETISIVNTNDIDPLDLPQEGTFLEYKKEESRRYLLRKLQLRSSDTLTVTPAVKDRIVSYASETTAVSNKQIQQMEFHVYSPENATFACVEQPVKEILDRVPLEYNYQNNYLFVETDSAKRYPRNEQIVFAA